MKNKSKNNIFSTIKKLWSNERSRAGIQLGFYLMFFILVIIVINISSKLNNPSRLNTEVSLQTMKSILSKNNYEYNYIINTPTEKIIFNGKKSEEENTGIKQTREKNLKYSIENDIVYELQIDNKVEIDNFYDGFDEKLININYILDLIKDKSATITSEEENKIYMYQFDINNEFIEMLLKTDKEKITNITIKYKDITYDLNFKNYGKVN